MYLQDYSLLDTKGFTRGRRGCETSSARAVAPVRAGMLLEHVRKGVQPHSTFEGLHDRVFVVPGVELGSTKDTYDVGDIVPFIRGAGRAGVYVLLKGGQRVRRGDYLVSAGDGTLINYLAGSKHPLAYAAKSLEDAAVLEDTIIAAECVPGHGELHYLLEPKTLAPGEVI